MQISNGQIDSIYRAVISQTRKQQADRTQKGESKPQGRDEAVISSRAADMAKFKEVLKSTPDVREDRISELAEQIKQGTYRPSASDIAEKMLLRDMADRLR